MSTKKQEEDTILIYALPGSQYVAKVLSAIDARKVPHFVEMVALKRSDRKLPSGGYLVPEMVVSRSGQDDIVVAGSEDILHWLDDHRDTKYFPNQLASHLSVRASDGVLAGAVLYYNWIHQKGYERSMKKKIADAALPSWLPCRSPLVDFLLKSTRKSFRRKAAKGLGLEESDLEDEDRVHKLLLDELSFFQSHLKESSDRQPYLLPGKEGTAADFSVYGQLDRIIGTMGDAELFPSLPDLVEERSQLNRFWEWHGLMQERHPFKYWGKEQPK